MRKYQKIKGLTGKEYDVAKSIIDNDYKKLPFASTVYLREIIMNKNLIRIERERPEKRTMKRDID